MKRLILFGVAVMVFISVFGQEKPRRDTVPPPKTTHQPPDTAFRNPMYKGPAEIDTINRSDSLKGGRRSNPINRYREDSVPKSPRLY